MFDKYFEKEYNNNKELMTDYSIFNVSVSFLCIFVLGTGVLNYSI